MLSPTNEAICCQLRELFRTGAGLTPVLARSAWVEPNEEWACYRVWVGQGFYEIPYDLVTRILETRDVAGRLRFVTGIHPGKSAWPIVSRLAQWTLGPEKYTKRMELVLEELWPELGRVGAFQLNDDQMSILGIECFEVIGKAIELVLRNQEIGT